MFTGIVRALLKVECLERKPHLIRLAIPRSQYLENVEKGASVAINGVCLTVVEIESKRIWFDVIQESLDCTNLSILHSGDYVNVERSAKIGDEIGGHLLSGHIYGTATIEKIEHLGNDQKIVTFRIPETWVKYLFSKGYIALNGASLTLVEVEAKGLFTVHLIPETLRATNFGGMKVGDQINVELDSQTQTIVDTIERYCLSDPFLASKIDKHSNSYKKHGE